jgi:hypothetical protein
MIYTDSETNPTENDLWTVELGLRGGASIRLTLSSGDKTNLEDRLTNWDYYYRDKFGLPLFSFNSVDYSATVNLGQVTYSRIMIGVIPPEQPDAFPDIREAAPPIRVWMIGQQQSLEFVAEPDEASEDDLDEEESPGQLKEMLNALPYLFDVFVSFLDCDDERVYLRVAEIAVIVVPNWLLDTDELDELEESEDEEDLPGGDYDQRRS